MAIPVNPVFLALQSLGFPISINPFRIENPFGIVTDVTVIEDTTCEIFWSASDDWFKITPQFNGKITTPGILIGTLNGTYDGANLAVVSGTEYFLGDGDLTAKPITAFPTNGQELLVMNVSSDPTGGVDAVTHMLFMVSHGDGVADDNDYVSGFILTFVGTNITPYN